VAAEVRREITPIQHPGAVRIPGMKVLLLTILVSVGFTACHGPGGPATRAGRTVDHAVSNVGHGVERTGEAIQDAAN
jgi:hypothetical protein